MTPPDLTKRLARLALFADLSERELEALEERCGQASFDEGEFVLRKGDPGTSLFVILEGEVAVVVEAEERATLSVGGFFGEVSLLLGEPVMADIVTRSRLHCLVIPGSELDEVLLANARVALNMLRTEARRVRSATEWHS